MPKNTLVGYARCSTTRQDLAIQKKMLLELGVPQDRIYTDKGLTGTKRERPGLDQALAAVREGDSFLVSKLDRLARSVLDARDIEKQLEENGVKLQIGSTIYDGSNRDFSLNISLGPAALLRTTIAFVCKVGHDLEAFFFAQAKSFFQLKPIAFFSSSDICKCGFWIFLKSASKIALLSFGR